jgi:UDP-N-acetylmuramoyl-L-alanyl-D-glutamate--2,6-diaminopimelate ligase
MTRSNPAATADCSLSTVMGELGELCVRAEGIEGVHVCDVELDSRRVRPGTLFVARRGSLLDGACFTRDAVERGAVALMISEEAEVLASGVPVLRVRDVDRAAGVAAQAVWGNPARTLDVVGITGTNGKTTTAWLVASALEELGSRAARLGTLGFAQGSLGHEDTLTTPGPDDLARYMARCRAAGGQRFVMEVSSHALAQGRVDGVAFAVVAFTNLTQDHLDYHGSMEAYGAAKARLFDELQPRAAVIYGDDPFGATLRSRTTASRVLVVGRDGSADIAPRDVVQDRRGLRGLVRTPEGPVEIASGLVGTHNLSNLLLALGIGIALGHDASAFARALSSVPGVPGRLERCDGPEDDVVVLVDYAHTPDALERVLDAVRELSAGELVCVFGCGGDRDATKRPLMGAAVGRRASRALITNDNPRTEDPRLIAQAIEAGLAPSGIPYQVILDRAEAITQAVTSAQAGDVILIAGKGHEPYQIIGDASRAFDDRVEARRALLKRRGAQS